jgi:CO/xanthine dehydrogenase FAD-binding subunit
MVVADGRSPFTSALLAMDVSMDVYQFDKEPDTIKLGDWLPLRGEYKTGRLITMFNIPTNIQLAFEAIARSPADRPIVCAAVCQWSSGRTRLVLGGWGQSPKLAMDGPNSDGIDIAAKDAYSSAGDQWASAEYRMEMAGVLATRCLKRLNLKNS